MKFFFIRNLVLKIRVKATLFNVSVQVELKKGGALIKGRAFNRKNTVAFIIEQSISPLFLLLQPSFWIATQSQVHGGYKYEETDRKKI